MAIAMVALLAFGGTYAYFTATAQSQGVTGITTATVAISTGAANSQTASAAAKTNALPGEKVFNDVAITVTNTSTVDVYVFATVTTGGSAKGLVVKAGSKDAAPIVSVDYAKALENGWEKYADGVYYFKTSSTKALEATNQFAFSATFNKDVQSKNVHNGTAFAETTNVYLATDANYETCQSVMGVTFSVDVTFAAIQVLDYEDSVGDAYTALTQSFAKA